MNDEDTEHEAPTETEAEAAEPAEMTPEDLATLAQLELQWAEFFRVILAERDPIGAPEDCLVRTGTKRVRDAEADALAACYRAIERFAGRFAPA